MKGIIRSTLIANAISGVAVAEEWLRLATNTGTEITGMLGVLHPPLFWTGRDYQSKITLP